VGATLPLATPFTTSSGRSVTLRDVLPAGKPALLVLSYSHCALLCSTVLRGVADLVRQLDAEPRASFGLVNVSIDPRETPQEAGRVQAAMLERAGRAGKPASFPFVVGNQQAVDAVARSVGFRYAWDARTQQYAHPAALIVLAPNASVARYFYGVRFDAAEVRRALEGRERAPASAATALTCFRLDGLEQRFGKRLTWALRLGGALVLVTLLLGIAALRRAEGRRAR
jgi:protein SCO1/2